MLKVSAKDCHLVFDFKKWLNSNSIVVLVLFWIVLRRNGQKKLKQETRWQYFAICYVLFVFT